MLQAPKLNVVKASGEIEPYDRGKLQTSLINSGVTGKIIDEIISHTEEDLKDGMSTSQIYKHAYFLLKKRLKPSAVKYSLRQAVMGLGPTGFSFEDYIANILREKGYEAKTGEFVFGGCVQHEVDVVAWNENKLIVVEAKFHNALGIKSDLKVALYVKARFDDLKEVKHMYGKERDIDEAWLITNTKFTSTAIHYAECKNLTLIGWNYPKKGNLQNMIEDGDLHPITCLTSLTGSQKKALLSQGIVLSKNIKEDPNILKSMGFVEEKIKKVVSEIESL